MLSLIDGSTVSISILGSEENLHFFTDRVADAILNPSTLPFSLIMKDYILVIAESIGRRCSSSTEQLFSLNTIMEWANESYSHGMEISRVREKISDTIVGATRDGSVG